MGPALGCALAWLGAVGAISLPGLRRSAEKHKKADSAALPVASERGLAEDLGESLVVLEAVIELR